MIAGTKVFTASGIVNATGVPITLYAVNIVCDGTAGLLSIYNNSESSADPIMQITGVANKGTLVYFPGGIVIPDDCYMDLDVHVLSCTAVYTKLGAAKPLPVAGVYATGNFTFVGDDLAGIIITVGGASLTEGVQWTVDVDPEVSAASLTAAINTAHLAASATALADGAIVNITASNIGTQGNNISLLASNFGSGDLTRSGAKLTGGVDPVAAT